MNAWEYMLTESDKRHAEYAEAQKAYYAKQISVRDVDTCYRDGFKNLELKYETLVQFMDSDLREELCFELAPCSELHFLRIYCEKHLAKFGEEFTFPN